MMRHAVTRALVAGALSVALCSAATAQSRAGTNAVPLHDFTGFVLNACTGASQFADGAFPSGVLTAGPSGVLYGTASSGGTCGAGIVFRLVPRGATWTYQIVYEFRGAADGGGPLGGIVFDASGHAYGTTSFAGSGGRGTVFELTPQTSGQWTLRTLYAFAGGDDGAIPFGTLAMEPSGALVGTTSIGGHSHIGCLQGCGTIFRLVHTAHGPWKEHVLHRFRDAFGEGAEPRAGLVSDAAGNFYGTTYYGGDDSECSGMGCGTAFELRNLPRGRWALDTFHRFEVTEGAFPRGPVTLDGHGNLYGTAMEGGTANDGTVFRFNDASGRWKSAGTFSFTGGNGRMPSGPLLLAPSGTLYGTTFSGGAQFWGTVFAIAPGASSWQENVVYSFTDGTDGATPLDANVLFDAAGNAYTMAYQGGIVQGCSGAGCGTVVEIRGAR